jgi:hypothetical protein
VKVDAGGLFAANDNGRTKNIIRGLTFAKSWHFMQYRAAGSINPSDIGTVLLSRLVLIGLSTRLFNYLHVAGAAALCSLMSPSKLGLDIRLSLAAETYVKRRWLNMKKKLSNSMV